MANKTVRCMRSILIIEAASLMAFAGFLYIFWGAR